MLAGILHDVDRDVPASVLDAARARQRFEEWIAQRMPVEVLLRAGAREVTAIPIMDVW